MDCSRRLLAVGGVSMTQTNLIRFYVIGYLLGSIITYFLFLPDWWQFKALWLINLLGSVWLVYHLTKLIDYHEQIELPD